MIPSSTFLTLPSQPFTSKYQRVTGVGDSSLLIIQWALLKFFITNGAKVTTPAAVACNYLVTFRKPS